jgi:hypothetical protein
MPHRSSSGFGRPARRCRQRRRLTRRLRRGRRAGLGRRRSQCGCRACSGGRPGRRRGCGRSHADDQRLSRAAGHRACGHRLEALRASGCRSRRRRKRQERRVDRRPAEHGAEQQTNVTDSRHNHDRPGHAKPSQPAAGRIDENRALLAVTVRLATHDPPACGGQPMGPAFGVDEEDARAASAFSAWRATGPATLHSGCCTTAAARPPQTVAPARLARSRNCPRLPQKRPID